MINLRPKAEEHVFLRMYGGHIGYSVRPSKRMNGVGTAMLRDMLEICRKEYGLKRVLITCLRDNEGSKRVIMNNGGRFECEVYYPPEDSYLRRFWISL